MSVPLQPRQHINSLYNQRVNNQLWRQDMRNLTSFASGSLYGRFICELFQNTDDARGRSLQLCLEGSRLTITHDGIPFTSGDVERIVSFASRNFQTKSEDVEATGFKGIGFKGLLSLASRVHIISGGYSFVFDQARWPDQSLPWQMIPIWEEPPKDVDLNSKVTTFIFNLTAPERVRAQMELFTRSPVSSLFLRSVQNITFITERSQTSFVRVDCNRVRKLCTGDVTKDFLLIQKSMGVTPDLQAQLRKLNPTVCPDRVKSAASIEITFAFLSNNNTVICPEERCFLFNTLPTKVDLDLPFRVNTAFLLDPQREHLVDHEFNDTLIFWIAYYHFSCLRELAQEANWKHVLCVIAPVTISTAIPNFNESYQRGFNEGLKEFAWIPSYGEGLLKAQECLVDETGFYQALMDKMPRHLIPKNLAHPGLEGVDKLISIVGSNYPENLCNDQRIFDTLCEIFQENPDPSLCYHVLSFFEKRFSEQSSTNSGLSWLGIKEVRFIVSASNFLEKLGMISLPNQNDIPLPPSFINIPIIHPDILKLDEDNKLRGWFERQNIRALSKKQIIGTYIFAFLQSTYSVDQSRQLVNYLFGLFLEGKINTSDLGKLRTMPLLSLSGDFQPAHKLYLPQLYRVQQGANLEQILPPSCHASFMDSSYLLQEQDISKRRKFFIALGLKAELKLHTKTGKVTIGELQSYGLYKLSEYLQYLRSSPDRIFKDEFRPEHWFLNFCYFPHMEAMGHIPFASYFWTQLNERSDTFASQDSDVQFITASNQSRPLRGKKLTYIQYVLRMYQLTQGSNKQLEKVPQLYSPALSGLGIPDLITASIQCSLSDELIEYLGFRTSISLDICHTTLDKQRRVEPFNPELYKTVLQQLIIGLSRCTFNEKQECMRRDWRFLASNNTWTEVSSLSCFAIPRASPQTHSDGWFKNVLEGVTMEKLAQHFRRPIIRGSFDESQVRDNAEEDSEYKDKIGERLHLFAWYLANHLNQRPKTILEELFNKWHGLSIYKAVIPRQRGMKQQQIVSVPGKIYFTSQCIEAHITRAVGEQLGFAISQLEEFEVIYNLRQGHSTRQTSTFDEWIEEHEVPEEIINDLKLYLSSLRDQSQKAVLAEPPEISPPISPSHIVTSQTELVDDSSTNSESPSLSDCALELHAVPESTGSQSATLDRPTDTSQLIEGRGIERLEIQKDYQMLRRKARRKTVRLPQRKTSDEQKTEIGRWGERYAFNSLRAHYEKKHSGSFQELIGGLYELQAANGTKITLKWVNEQQESYEPFDMVITKTKIDGSSKRYFVEIKSTRGGEVHFSMSDNEWKLMKEKKVNYRLYLVLNAKTEGATMKVIKKPCEWMDGAGVEIKRKYEIRAKEAKEI